MSSLLISNEITGKTIDWELCKKLAGYKEDLADEMLTMLINNLPTDKINIIQAYKNNNLNLLRDTVHKLHGACCYIGVPKLKNLAKELETSIATNASDKIKTFLSELEHEIDEVLRYYKNEILQTIQ